MSITLRANTIGSFAAEALETLKYAGIIGQVVNTFSNSFYVKTVNGELVFVTNRPLRSPVTINLDPTPSLDQIIRPLDLVHSYGNQIQLSGILIDLRDVGRCQSESEFPSHLDRGFKRIERALGIICFILDVVDTTQSALDPHGLAHDGTVRFANDGILPLRHKGMEQRFRETALTIVGLGSGFTPSGDDILGGFLATYNALARTVERRSIVLNFPMFQNRTSWVSAKLLDYMQRLILDEQLSSVIQAGGWGVADSLVLEVEALLPRGHTSGIDMTVGAILALSIVRDIAYDIRETETVIGKLALVP